MENQNIKEIKQQIANIDFYVKHSPNLTDGGRMILNNAVFKMLKHLELLELEVMNVKGE